MSDRLMAFVSTTQPDRARHFYQDVLGLNLISEDPIALVFNCAGTMLRITVVKEFSPQPFTVLGWRVADLSSRMKELSAKGVTFEQFGFPTQDEIGIWTTRDGAQIAWFKDPDGNLLSLTQFPGRQA